MSPIKVEIFDLPVIELLLDPNARIIPLTKGRYAIVDKDDWERASRFKWNYGTHGYAMRQEGGRRNRRTILMHRFILPTESAKTDHENGNRLDYRRRNLRGCTNVENGRNKSVSKRNKLGIKGVWWVPDKRAFVSQITIGGKARQLGYFPTKASAKDAWNRAAQALHGEFFRP